MRTIKFRGLRKDKLSADFIIGSLIVEPNGSYWIDWFEDGVRRTTEVIPETVGQFTGLTDKNGLEIYEGDIVICDKSTEPEDLGFICQFKDYRWKFNNVRFPDDDFYGTVNYNYIIENCEVIGNIHQNK